MPYTVENFSKDLEELDKTKPIARTDIGNEEERAKLYQEFMTFVKDAKTAIAPYLQTDPPQDKKTVWKLPALPWKNTKLIDPAPLTSSSNLENIQRSMIQIENAAKQIFGSKILDYLSSTPQTLRTEMGKVTNALNIPGVKDREHIGI